MSIFHAAEGRRLFKGERLVVAAFFLISAVAGIHQGDWQDLVMLATAICWWLYACLLESRLWGRDE